jgi:hypothetical protein
MSGLSKNPKFLKMPWFYKNKFFLKMCGFSKNPNFSKMSGFYQNPNFLKMCGFYQYPNFWKISGFYQHSVVLTFQLYTEILSSQMQLHFSIYSSSLIHVSSVPAHQQVKTVTLYLKWTMSKLKYVNFVPCPMWSRRRLSGLRCKPKIIKYLLCSLWLRNVSHLSGYNTVN